LTKRKPELVIRAVQPVSQESIGAIGVRNGAARQASPASGPKERPVAGRALIHHLARACSAWVFFFVAKDGLY